MYNHKGALLTSRQQRPCLSAVALHSSPDGRLSSAHVTGISCAGSSKLAADMPGVHMRLAFPDCAEFIYLTEGWTGAITASVPVS